MFENANNVEQTAVADRQMLIVLLAHIPVVGLWVPMGYGTMTFALVSSVLVGALATGAYALLRGTRACGIVFGVCLMLFSAIMIQAQLGRIEMHFHIFSALALTIVYRDIAVILASAITITIHHLSLTALQLAETSVMGQDIIIFNYGCSWSTVFIHAGFVVFEAGILIYFARDMAQERRRNNAMVDIINAFEANNSLEQRLDQPGRTSEAFNNMLDRFEEMVVQFRAITTSLTSQSEKLSAHSSHTKVISEAQNSEMDQAASSTEEMSATIHEVAQNAQMASESANDAASATNEGNEKILDVVERSRKANDLLGNSVGDVANLAGQVTAISNFIQSISEISDQTNLLALNAAIEAARAGEHGRGFSVVADEVRGLSRRTHEFTEEIKVTIDKLTEIATNTQSSIKSSQSMSDEASGILEEARASMKRIDEAVQTLQSMNDQIASAAEEQATASDQINQNVQHVSERNQEVLEGAQSTQHISEDMTGLAEQAEALVSKYKTRSA